MKIRPSEAVLSDRLMGPTHGAVSAQSACLSCAARLMGRVTCAGKGMHSRLYRRVLNQYEWVHNCTAFSSLYNNSGLVGVFISTERSRSGQSFDIITKELQVRAPITSKASACPLVPPAPHLKRPLTKSTVHQPRHSALHSEPSSA